MAESERPSCAKCGNPFFVSAVPNERSLMPGAQHPTYPDLCQRQACRPTFSESLDKVWKLVPRAS